VEKAFLIAVEFNARVFEFLEIGEGRQVDEITVGEVRQDHAHIHSTHRRELQGGDDLVVGNEVGGGDPDPVAGTIDEGEKSHRAGLEGIGGAGREAERLHLARDIVGPDLPVELVEQLPGRPAPILGEGNLKAFHDGAAPFHVGVPPRVSAWDPAEVFVAHIEAAEESALAVHHDDLAVVAEVQLKAVRLPDTSMTYLTLIPSRSMDSMKLGGKTHGAEVVEEEMTSTPSRAFATSASRILFPIRPRGRYRTA
jgi:hypothetical protein